MKCFPNAPTCHLLFSRVDFIADFYVYKKSTSQERLKDFILRHEHDHKFIDYKKEKFKQWKLALTTNIY